MTCERCLKPTSLCVCDRVVPIATRHQVLILQHPQEPDVELGTARLAHLALPGSALRVGLSWPNLKAALGQEATPARWAVLYLGSGSKPGGGAPAGPLQLVAKSGQLLPDQPGALAALDGLIVLDGTWSQAKALWWRNAWLLKCRRAVLAPTRPSRYGRLRREPRRECLSTIESVGAALVAMGEPEAVREGLDGLLEALLERYRAVAAS